MQFITTISQKGQVVVPKKVREQLNLSKLDKLAVEVVGNKIVMSSISSSDDVFGMFRPKSVISKEDIKQAKIKSLQKKFL